MAARISVRKGGHVEYDDADGKYTPDGKQDFHTLGTLFLHDIFW